MTLEQQGREAAGEGTHAAEALERTWYVSAEEARPVAWRVFLLGLLCPGLGWARAGRPAVGWTANLLLVSLWLLFGFLWSAVKFLPIAALAWMTVAWALTVAMSAGDAAHALRTRAPFRAARFSWPQAVAMASLTWFLPLAGLVVWAQHGLFTVATVEQTAMFPTLLPGDRVLIDRTPEARRALVPGMVVALRPVEAGGGPRFARVIAVAGQRVSLADGELYVDERLHEQGPVSQPYSDMFVAATGSDPAAVEARFESNGVMVYAVAGPPMPPAHPLVDIELTDGQVFVLHDNRSDPRDSRSLGPIPEDEVLGMPLYVLGTGSHYGEALSAYRRGRRIQPPRYVERGGSARAPGGG